MRKPQPNPTSLKAWARGLTDEQLKRAIEITQGTINEIADHLAMTPAQQK